MKEEIPHYKAILMILLEMWLRLDQTKKKSNPAWGQKEEESNPEWIQKEK